jgi:16S rRNA (uracil1498-N3)-methyltransferase
MPHDRYFSDEPLLLGKRVALIENEFHHLKHVMKREKGDLIEIVNGKGQCATGKIFSIHSKEVLVDLLDVQTQKAPPFSLYLAQAQIAHTKLDWVLEKGCELGVTDFFLFPTDFSSKPSSKEARQQRNLSLLISSIKQCGRLFLPKITFLPNLSALSSLQATFYFGDLKENAPLLKDSLKSHPISQTPCLCIGPEKGFSSDELFFLENKLHANGVRLHLNILRSETASIMGISLFAHYLL